MLTISHFRPSVVLQKTPDQFLFYNFDSLQFFKLSIKKC